MVSRAASIMASLSAVKTISVVFCFAAIVAGFALTPWGKPSTVSGMASAKPPRRSTLIFSLTWPPRGTVSTSTTEWSLKPGAGGGVIRSRYANATPPRCRNRSAIRTTYSPSAGAVNASNGSSCVPVASARTKSLPAESDTVKTPCSGEPSCAARNSNWNASPFLAGKCHESTAPAFSIRPLATQGIITGLSGAPYSGRSSTSSRIGFECVGPA